MMDIEIPVWGVLLAVVLRLYFTIIVWSFPIAAVLAAVHRHDENRRKYRGFLVWVIISGMPWAVQPVFWALGMSKHGIGWLLGPGR